MVCTNGKLVFSKLKKAYTINEGAFVSQYLFSKYHDAFKVLIATILSQNSSDRSALLTFGELENKIGVSPETLHEASIQRLQQAMRKSGLYKSKSRYIKSIADTLVRDSINLQKRIDSLGPEGSRRFLTSFYGVGKKTADVTLLTVAGYPFFPVDRHIARVSARLGITSKGDDYDTMSLKISRLFNRRQYLLAHQLLITHGRETCKVINPRCSSCVLNFCCTYYASITARKIYK